MPLAGSTSREESATTARTHLYVDPVGPGYDPSSPIPGQGIAGAREAFHGRAGTAHYIAIIPTPSGFVIAAPRVSSWTDPSARRTGAS